MKPNNEIFVFGSNEAGRHGKGAAAFAKKNHGAVSGVGHGLEGNSYALPTKDRDLRRLTLLQISGYVDIFLVHAECFPENIYLITRVGCGLAGFKDEEIAPLFKEAPRNCYFDKKWKPYLGGDFNYWGTYFDK